MTELVVERRAQPDRTPTYGDGMVMVTPPVSEDYWSYRVRLGDKQQAIIAFPKFGTIGIGFAQEEDWNTNLPYTCASFEIFDHIKHNKGDDAISDADVLEAIRLVRAAIDEDRNG